MIEKDKLPTHYYPLAPVWIIRGLVGIVILLGLVSGYYFTKFQNVRNTLLEVRKVCPYQPQ